MTGLFAWRRCESSSGVQWPRQTPCSQVPDVLPARVTRLRLDGGPQSLGPVDPTHSTVLVAVSVRLVLCGQVERRSDVAVPGLNQLSFLWMGEDVGLIVEDRGNHSPPDLPWLDALA